MFFGTASSTPWYSSRYSFLTPPPSLIGICPFLCGETCVYIETCALASLATPPQQQQPSKMGLDRQTNKHAHTLTQTRRKRWSGHQWWRHHLLPSKDPPPGRSVDIIRGLFEVRHSKTWLWLCHSRVASPAPPPRRPGGGGAAPGGPCRHRIARLRRTQGREREEGGGGRGSALLSFSLRFCFPLLHLEIQHAALLKLLRPFSSFSEAE